MKFRNTLVADLVLLSSTISTLGNCDEQRVWDSSPVFDKRTESRSLSVPAEVPDNAGPILDPTFPAFAFEARSLIFYAGNGSMPNTFSQNLLEAITSRTNVKPIIRVGGTSLDHSYYDPHQTEIVQYPAGQEKNNVPFGLVFGPSYFESYANFDAGYIFDLPLAKNNLSGTLLFAKAGYDAIGVENIYLLECGNEPNSYPGTDRKQSFSPKAYVRNWINFTTEISNELGLSTDDPIWEFGGLTTDLQPRWQVPKLFNRHGLSAAVSRIRSISVHYYQTFAGESLQGTLMNHTYTVTRSAFLKPGLNYALANGIPFNLDEIGSALNPGYNDMELEGVLGSALWHVDFFMLMMSLGVNRINYQQGIGFGFSLWQPTRYRNAPAHVRGPFYGQVFAADFVGPSGQTQVVNFDQQSDLLAAYAAYDAGVLKRIAIVNLDLWTPIDGVERPEVEYTVDIPTDSTEVRIARLMSPEGGRAIREKSLSWAGLQWTYASNGIARAIANGGNATVPVQDGQAKVTIPASEAVMIFV